MNEIKCPHCGQTFTVDEAGYADIVKQVRDSEFEQQLHDRLELADHVVHGDDVLHLHGRDLRCVPDAYFVLHDMQDGRPQ